MAKLSEVGGKNRNETDKLTIYSLIIYTFEEKEKSFFKK